MKKRLFIWVFLVPISLTGCSDSGSGDISSAPLMEDMETESSTENQLSKVANNSAESDTETITDAAQMHTDITSLFGSADDEPVQIHEGNSILDLINSASRP